MQFSFDMTLVADFKFSFVVLTFKIHTHKTKLTSIHYHSNSVARIQILDAKCILAFL